MSTAFLIWAYLAVGKLNSVLDPLAGIGIIAIVIVGIIHIVVKFSVDEASPKKFEEALKLMSNFTKSKLLWSIIVLNVLLTVTYPSKEDLKWIIGGVVTVGTIKSVSDIKGANELPANIVGAMNRFLEGVNGDTTKQVTKAVSDVSKATSKAVDAVKAETK